MLEGAAPPRKSFELKPVDADNDIETALLVIMLERANILTTQLTDQIKQMKNRNEVLRILNDIMTKLNNTVDKQTVNPDDKYGKDAITLPDGTKTSIRDFLTQYGGVDAGKLPSGSSWDNKQCQLVGGYVKGSMDSMNSDAQQDQLRLQSLNSKRDQAYDTATNFVSSSNKAKSNIIGNLR